MVDELLILLLSKDSFTDYICNYLLMDGHYVDVAEDIESAKIMMQIRKYDLLLICFTLPKHEEAIIYKQFKRIDSSIKILSIFQMFTQSSESLSWQERSSSCPVASILESLPIVIGKIRLNKLFENLSIPHYIPCDRRREIRAAAKIPVKYYFQDMQENIFPIEMISRGMDLSKDGIKLIVDDSITILPYVNLDMLLPFSADPVHIVGETRWAKGNLRFPWKDVGVQFFNIKSEDILRITDYINLYSRKILIH